MFNIRIRVQPFLQYTDQDTDPDPGFFMTQKLFFSNVFLINLSFFHISFDFDKNSFKID